MKDLTIVDVFEDKIVFPSKTYTVGDKGIPWLKINFKYLYGLQTLNGLKIEVKYDLPKGFVLDEYTLDSNNSAEFSINQSVFSFSGWIKIFITLKKDANNIITTPGEISLRVRNLNIDNNEVAPVYEVLIQKVANEIDAKIDEAIIVANKMIEEIKTTQGMKGEKGDQGEKGEAGSLINIANDEEVQLWLGTTADYEAIVEKSKGVLYQHFDADGNFVGGYYKRALEPATRCILRHFDFMDGKGAETELTDRVSGEKLTLSNFNFDENSGWTGTGLKFDNIDDIISLSKILNGSKKDEYMYVCLTILTNITSNSAWRSVRGDSSSVYDYFTISNSVCNFRRSNSLPFQGGEVAINKKGINIKMFSTAISTGDLVNFKLQRPDTVMILHSILSYSEELTEDEVKQNYEYEQSIDRTIPSTYPLLQEELSYGIGNVEQLSEEQKASFRLSLDGTKFVAGLRYCKDLDVIGYTYSNIQKEMEKEEWKFKEIEVLNE